MEPYLQDRKRILLENLQSRVGPEKAEVLVEAIMKDCRANELGYMPLTILELSDILEALGATVDAVKAQLREALKSKRT